MDCATCARVITYMSRHGCLWGDGVGIGYTNSGMIASTMSYRSTIDLADSLCTMTHANGAEWAEHIHMYER